MDKMLITLIYFTIGLWISAICYDIVVFCTDGDFSRLVFIFIGGFLVKMLYGDAKRLENEQKQIRKGTNEKV